MSKTTRTVVVLSCLIFILMVASIVNARWECSGVCEGCTLYCSEEEITECCAYCLSRPDVACCFPSEGCHFGDD